jgi:excinuclease ABC subunit A
MDTFIEIKGARENNLKNISLRIPKNKLVVFTGLSGSGKSTLALVTLQKECQRQYMESMGLVTDFISKPKVDAIIVLSPSISRSFCKLCHYFVTCGTTIFFVFFFDRHGRLYA